MEGTLEIIEHGFMKCIAMIEAWNNFRDFKTKCSLQLGHNTWEEILFGEMEPLKQDPTKVEIPWEVEKL